MAATLAARPRPKAVPLPFRPERRGNPPAFSAAASACAMNGLARRARPLSRIRPVRTLNSSSLVTTPMLARCMWSRFSKGMREMTSCPACSHLARNACSVCVLAPTDRAAPCGFYLAIARSYGLLPLASLSNMRDCSTACETHPNKSSRPPLWGTRHNRLFAGDLLAVGAAFPRSVDCGSSAVLSRLDTPEDLPSEVAGFAGNNALDHPRSRSSIVTAGAIGGARGSGADASDAISAGSKFASFGSSKFGALPFSTVTRTACANVVSGRSQEP